MSDRGGSPDNLHLGRAPGSSNEKKECPGCGGMYGNLPVHLRSCDDFVVGVFE